jgi:hypothetical protein
VYLFDPELRRSGLKPPAGIEVRDLTGPKGLGVFALRDFQAGTLVEACPVVLLRGPWDSLPAALKDKVFDWEDLTGQGGGQALALGYGSLYNGGNPANMRYEAVPEARSFIQFIADRTISAGEELTVNYSGSKGAAQSANDWWFDRRGIKRL